MRLVCAVAVCLLLAGSAWGEAVFELDATDVEQTDVMALSMAGCPSVFFQRGGMEGFSVPGQETAENPGSDKALRGDHFTASGETMAMFLDHATDDSAKWDALYADVDSDGEFSGREKFRAKGWEGGQTAFGPMKLRLGEGKAKAFLVLEGTMGELDEYAFGVLVPEETMRGKVRLGGSEYRVEVIDTDLDGSYSRPATKQGEGGEPAMLGTDSGSAIAIDLNGDGYAYRMPYSAYEMPGMTNEVFPPGSMMQTGKEWVRVDVSADGEELTVSDPLPTGKVGFDGERLSVKLRGTDGGEVMVSDATGAFEAPTGAYQIADFKLTVGEDGKEWSLACANYQLGDLRPPLEVSDGGTAHLALAPRVDVGVYASADADSGEFRISLQAVGPDGMSVVDVLAGDEKPGAPKFSLVDDEGKVLESGEFEYG